MRSLSLCFLLIGRLIIHLQLFSATCPKFNLSKRLNREDAKDTKEEGGDAIAPRFPICHSIKLFDCLILAVIVDPFADAVLPNLDQQIT